MSRSVLLGLLVACVVVLSLFAPAATCACELDRLLPWNWFSGPASETTYAPPYVPGSTSAPAFNPSIAPAYTPTVACNSCAPQACSSCSPQVCSSCTTQACSPCTSQFCSYVPQTSYRRVYRTVPTTTCQAVTSCDPCTGCPVTAYYPTTVYRRCAQLIPYTTYRIVWSNPCTTCYSPCATCYSPCATSCSSCTTSACGIGCGTTSHGAPITFGSSAVGIGSSCCGTKSIVRPNTPLSPSPDNNTSMPRKTIGTSSNVSSDAADSTPRWEKHNKPIDNGSLNSKPEPENDVQQKSFQTKPLTGNSNRTALRPVSRIQYVGNVHSERRSTMNINGPVDFSGWKSSNK